MRNGNGNACCAFESKRPWTAASCSSGDSSSFDAKWVSSRAGDKKADSKSTNALMDTKRLAVRTQQQQQQREQRMRKARKPHAKGLKTNTNRKVKQKQQQTEIEIEMHNSNNNKKNYLGQTHFWQGQRNAKPQQHCKYPKNSKPKPKELTKR